MVQRAIPWVPLTALAARNAAPFWSSQVKLLCCIPHDAEGESPGAADNSGGVEYMLLVALESLYSGNAERDVQLGVLRVLLNVLQVRGPPLQCSVLLGQFAVVSAVCCRNSASIQ